MADTLDLLLQGTGDGESLQASLASAGGLHSFALVPPQGLQRAYQAWRDRFLAHHNGTAVSAEAVQHYAAQLLRLLAGWPRLEAIPSRKGIFPGSTGYEPAMDSVSSTVAPLAPKLAVANKMTLTKIKKGTPHLTTRGMTG